MGQYPHLSSRVAFSWKYFKCLWSYVNGWRNRSCIMWLRSETARQFQGCALANDHLYNHRVCAILLLYFKNFSPAFAHACSAWGCVFSHPSCMTWNRVYETLLLPLLLLKAIRTTTKVLGNCGLSDSCVHFSACCSMTLVHIFL